MHFVSLLLLLHFPSFPCLLPGITDGWYTTSRRTELEEPKQNILDLCCRNPSPPALPPTFSTTALEPPCSPLFMASLTAVPGRGLHRPATRTTTQLPPSTQSLEWRKHHSQPMCAVHSTFKQKPTSCSIH